ncbi:hypothetical protein I4U23_027112 [Adineta vaga]|nr:hypothetical protein I4U23_027112 [Adineta vaga]
MNGSNEGFETVHYTPCSVIQRHSSMLENVEVTISDHIGKALNSNWSASCSIGMQPCEQSDQVAENVTSHTLHLAGIYRSEHDVLVRVRMVLEGTTTTIAIQLTIRSTDRSAVQSIAFPISYSSLTLTKFSTETQYSSEFYYC